MAAKKKRSRRQSAVSKILNVLLLGLGFARPIEILLTAGSISTAARVIVDESTAGLGGPAHTFSKDKLLRFYSPVGAAVGVGALKSYLLRKFPVR